MSSEQVYTQDQIEQALVSIDEPVKANSVVPEAKLDVALLAMVPEAKQGKNLVVDFTVSTTDDRHTHGLGMQIDSELAVLAVAADGQAIQAGIILGDVITKVGVVDFKSGKTDKHVLQMLSDSKTAGKDLIIEFNGGSAMPVVPEVELEMDQAAILKFQQDKAKRENAERMKEVKAGFFTLVMLVIFLALGTLTYKYNQKVETACPGDTPSPLEVVVVNSTLNGGQSLLYFDTDSALAQTMYAPGEIPAGSYVTSPDVPICEREWTVLEGFYFGMVTATTVGYGDLGPVDDKVLRCMVYGGLWCTMGYCVRWCICAV
jgi:hypothetical protein